MARKASYVLMPSTIALVFVFLSTMNRKYLKTFWSTETGKKVTLKYFESDEDSTKAVIFTCNYKHWVGIRKQVKHWVSDNWAEWNITEPDWLNDNMKARIPPDMVPDGKDRQRLDELRDELRKSSVMNLSFGRSTFRSEYSKSSNNTNRFAMEGVRRYSITALHKVKPLLVNDKDGNSRKERNRRRSLTT